MLQLQQDDISAMHSILHDPHTLWKGVSLHTDIITIDDDYDSDSDSSSAVDHSSTQVSVSLQAYIVVDSESPLLLLLPHQPSNTSVSISSAGDAIPTPHSTTNASTDVEAIIDNEQLYDIDRVVYDSRWLKVIDW